MSPVLKYVDPTLDKQWDKTVASFSDANIFHTSSWAQTLKASYGYQPVYAVWEKGGMPVCIVPLMEINSVITGKRGVSLPFTDWCPIVNDGSVAHSEVLSELVDEGKLRKWKSLELRESGGSAADDQNTSPYLVHELDLSPGEEGLFRQFRDSTRRNIRKAAKLGVTVVEDNSFSGLKEFCRLNVITRRDHGLPPQPAVFFENLYRNIIDQGSGKVLLARHEERTVAGAVYLSFNGRALYKYGASDRSQQHLRANNLLMWEAIKRYSEAGAGSLHFGKTDSNQSGLLQFKRGWGAEEGGLWYRKFKLPEGDLAPFESLTFGVHNRVFSRMPLTALEMIGKLLYRHMG
jgi:hypothetical protein